MVGLVLLLLLATVSDTPTTARAKDGSFISWKEHLIDDQQLSGGVKLRGADGVQVADLDRDGFADIVTVHEDSSHVRLAFGSASPDQWQLATLAEGDDAPAAEDAAIADLNGDGWPDVLVACELAHVIYFQNPGRADLVRVEKWKRVVPEAMRGRGSFIRVFAADLNRDGQPEVLAANKGEQLPTDNPNTQRDAKFPKKEISWFSVPKNPLDGKERKEQVLIRVEIPINAQPIDTDGDGDLDVLVGARGEGRSILFENVSTKGGDIRFKQHPIAVSGHTEPHKLGPKNLTSFMADAADLNGDGRVDLVMNETNAKLCWLEQPRSLDQPWKLHHIGTIGPDTPTGIKLADINSDGHLDVMTGGYSRDPRDHDGHNVTARDSSGRLAWFENPGDPAKPWKRHDISRTKRGMYDGFVARDMDGDGDIDFVGTRGNSGNFDGVFWMEQVRTREPRKAFTPARVKESEQMPLP